MSIRVGHQFLSSALAILILVVLAPAAASSAAAATPSLPRAAALAVSAGSFHAVPPSRVLDTRGNLGAVGPVRPATSIAVAILGRGGVPGSGVASVVINVTVTGPTQPGHITVYPDGTALPVVSNLNFRPNQTVPNLVVVRVGVNGKIRLLNSSTGSVALVGDVVGYFTAGTPTVAGAFQSVTPTRLLDTRIGLGAPAGRVSPYGSVAVKVTGTGVVPSSGVSAVLVNVTATNPTGLGYVTAYADGAAKPGVSNLNFSTSQTVPNLAMVPVGVAGRIRVSNTGSATVDLIVDVMGYYLAGAPGGAGTFQSIQPRRTLDTRIGLGAAAGRVAGSTSITVKMTGTGALPNPGVSAVVVNVTVVSPTAAGVVTVYPSGAPLPRTSNLNFVAGQTVANLVVVPVGGDGRIRLLSLGSSVYLVADVVGYYLDGRGAAGCNTIPASSTGTTVTRWNPLVLCILSVLGQSGGNVNDVDTMIRYESSGDPNAINLTDINAQRGHPSKGLIQVIQPTFDRYRSLQLPNDLFNPAANLFAGLHYAIANYGSIYNVPGLVSLRKGGPYVGYAIHN